jgi:hypothetical protein
MRFEETANKLADSHWLRSQFTGFTDRNAEQPVERSDNSKLSKVTFAFRIARIQVLPCSLGRRWSRSRHRDPRLLQDLENGVAPVSAFPLGSASTDSNRQVGPPTPPGANWEATLQPSDRLKL